MTPIGRDVGAGVGETTFLGLARRPEIDRLANKPFHLTPGLAPFGRSVRRR